jgi:hypothetical protein
LVTTVQLALACESTLLAVVCLVHVRHAWIDVSFQFIPVLGFGAVWRDMLQVCAN